MEAETKDKKSMETWEAIAGGIVVIGLGIFAFYVSEKVILFYEYGIRAVFEQDIHFVEMKPYIVTSAGDTLSRYHNLFHFLFPIVPFFISLFIIALLKMLFTKNTVDEA